MAKQTSKINWICKEKDRIYHGVSLDCLRIYLVRRMGDSADSWTAHLQEHGRRMRKLGWKPKDLDTIMAFCEYTEANRGRVVGGFEGACR